MAPERAERRKPVGVRLDDPTRADLEHRAEMVGINLSEFMRKFVFKEWIEERAAMFQHPVVEAELRRVRQTEGLTPKQREAARNSVLQTVMRLPLRADMKKVEF